MIAPSSSSPVGQRPVAVLAHRPGRPGTRSHRSAHRRGSRSRRSPDSGRSSSPPTPRSRSRRLPFCAGPPPAPTRAPGSRTARPSSASGAGPRPGSRRAWRDRGSDDVVPGSKKWYAADEQGSSWVSDGWHAGLQDAAPALQVALGSVLLVSALGKLRDRPALVSARCPSARASSEGRLSSVLPQRCVSPAIEARRRKGSVRCAARSYVPSP